MMVKKIEQPTNEEEEEKPKKLLTPAQTELHVRRVLIELLGTSESDTVRIAAAKALMDRIDKRKNELNAAKSKADKEENEKDQQEREEAIAEAYKLLSEITGI